jgi:CubicO group peptidase (beta-lactamase class C family)
MMQLYRAGVFLLLLLLLPGAGQAEEHFPGVRWENLPTDTAGWSSGKLAEAEAWSRQIGSTAVMIVQHGLVIAEWGDTTARAPLASVRKSLLSALIGIAVARHQINLDATLGSLDTDDNAPSLSAEEKTATVRDLLEARSGVYHPACYETTRMAELRPARFSHKPGTFWYYNNWDFNALGTIYEHAVRSSIYDAFLHEIAEPIGMEDYRSSDGEYVQCSASVHPAYTFNMSARDLVRFALLYLDGGKWQDRQIVPVQWVKDSTRAYSQSDFGPGYGYLWWTGFGRLPPGTFFAAGAGGQFAFVIPSSDLVLVHRAPHVILSNGSPRLSEIGRLLSLVLDAGGARRP